MVQSVVSNDPKLPHMTMSIPSYDAPYIQMHIRHLHHAHMTYDMIQRALSLCYQIIRIFVAKATCKMNFVKNIETNELNVVQKHCFKLSTVFISIKY